MGFNAVFKGLKEYPNFVVALLDCSTPLIPKLPPFTHSLSPARSPNPLTTALPIESLPDVVIIRGFLTKVLYRNKGKDHNSQTQPYFIKFLKYINNNMGYMFRPTSSHLQALKM